MSGVVSNQPPTLAGFLAFIATNMAIPISALPVNAPVIQSAFSVALEIVNPVIAQASAIIYGLCVYNLAGDNLINFAPDQPGQTFFADLRKQWDIYGFVSGVVQSTNDEGTGMSLLVPDVFKNLTLANLQQLKTPYGRQYLAYASSYGEIWGLT